MIQPNNKRIAKIMELLEQTGLFTSDDLTKIEDYLMEEEEREVEQLGLQNLEIQNLTESLKKFRGQFTSYKQGEKQRSRKACKDFVCAWSVNKQRAVSGVSDI